MSWDLLGCRLSLPCCGAQMHSAVMPVFLLVSLTAAAQRPEQQSSDLTGSQRLPLSPQPTLPSEAALRMFHSERACAGCTVSAQASASARRALLETCILVAE